MQTEFKHVVKASAKREGRVWLNALIVLAVWVVLVGVASWVA